MRETLILYTNDTACSHGSCVWGYNGRCLQRLDKTLQKMLFTLHRKGRCLWCFTFCHVLWRTVTQDIHPALSLCTAVMENKSVTPGTIGSENTTAVKTVYPRWIHLKTLHLQHFLNTPRGGRMTSQPLLKPYWPDEPFRTFYFQSSQPAQFRHFMLKHENVK